MPVDEVRSEDAVAIGEYQVVGLRGENGLIEDTSLAKPLVLLPDVAQLEAGLIRVAGDDVSSLSGGTVVGHDDFESGESLQAQGVQAEVEAGRLIIGRKNDRDTVLAGYHVVAFEVSGLARYTRRAGPRTLGIKVGINIPAWFRLSTQCIGSTIRNQIQEHLAGPHQITAAELQTNGY